MEHNFSHVETMQNLGIRKTDLPKEIQHMIFLHQKQSARAKHPDTIARLEDESDRIAAEIVAWHDDEDYEEPIPPVNEPLVPPTPLVNEPPVPPTPPVNEPPVPPAPPVNEPPAPPTPPSNEPPAPPADEPKSGWGLGFLSKW